jgi:hypothetical protein
MLTRDAKGFLMSMVTQSWLRFATLALVILGMLVFQTHHIGKRLEDLKNHLDGRFKPIEDRLETRHRQAQSSPQKSD